MREAQRNILFGRGRAAGFCLSVFLCGLPLANGDETRITASSVASPERGATASELGIASYYADKYHGNPTASGEIFDMHQLTAAHPRLAFGTRVKVTDLGNSRSVVVRINDRGPFVQGRVIDLSLAAAEELQMVQRGLARVKLEILP